MSARLIDGKAIAATIRARLAVEVEALRKSTNRTPQVGGGVGRRRSGHGRFMRPQQRTWRAAKAGSASDVHRLPGPPSQTESLEFIAKTEC